MIGVLIATSPNEINPLLTAGMLLITVLAFAFAKAFADLAGNRMDAVFDFDLGSRGSSMTPSTHRLIPFIPSPS